MRTRIEIENLRGVREGVIDDLAPMSILIGPNNSGKSTVLEAFWVHANGGDAGPVFDLLLDRGWCGPECARQVCFEPGQQVVVRGWEKEKVSTIGFQIVETFQPADRYLHEHLEGFEPALQISTYRDGGEQGKGMIDAEGQMSHLWGTKRKPDGILVRVGTISHFGQVEDAYSAAVAKGLERQVQELLPRLGLEHESLRILKRGKEYVLHTIADGRPAIPIYLSGDGFKRLLFIACVLAEHTGGLVLLEEPEAFQHPRYLRELAGLIWGAIGQGTQVILSTHSLDLLRFLLLDEHAALDAAAVFKTSLKDNVLRAARIPGQRAAERVEDLAEDLRL